MCIYICSFNMAEIGELENIFSLLYTHRHTHTHTHTHKRIHTFIFARQSHHPSTS